MVPIAPYAVQGAVMGLFPLPDALPARVTQTREGLSLLHPVPGRELRPNLPEGADQAAGESPDTAQEQPGNLTGAADASRVGSPGAGPYVPVADVGVIPTRKEKGGRFIEDIKDSSSTVKVSP